MKIKILLLIILSVILASCNTTNPNVVKKSDTQKINSNKIKLFSISRMLMFFCYQGFIPKGYQE